MSDEKKYVEVKRIEHSVSKVKEQIATLYDQHSKLYSDTSTRCQSIRSDLIECLNYMNILCGYEESLLEVTKPAMHRTYSAKEVVSHFSNKLLDASKSGTFLLQSTLCCRSISNWFTLRFTNRPRASLFKYNAQKIPDWIDAIILSYGKAIEEGRRPEFEAKFSEWLATTADQENKWALPPDVQHVMSSVSPSDYTLASVILEYTLKPLLYSETFFPEYTHSIEARVKVMHPDLVETIDRMKTDTTYFNENAEFSGFTLQ